MLVGALMDRRVDRGELLARRKQEGADGGGPPDVLVLHQRLEPVPALAEEHRILAAALAPGDEIFAGVGRRVEIPAIGLDARGRRGRCKTGRCQRRAAGDESASLQNILLGAGPTWRRGTRGCLQHLNLIRELWRICQCEHHACVWALGQQGLKICEEAHDPPDFRPPRFSSGDLGRRCQPAAGRAAAWKPPPPEAA